MKLKEQALYHFHPQFIFRTPLIPLQKNNMNRDSKGLWSYSQQPFFKEAIYLASPVLHDQLIKWHKDELRDEKEIDKLVLSIYKYYSRMQTRCTPYGLFAGCSTGIWGPKNEIITTDYIKRHTRLDMNYLCALAQKLNTHSIILPLLLFYPNNSIYLLGSQLRFVEYKYVNNRRIHQISSIDYNNYLQIILEKAKPGSTISELSNILVDDDITYAEAEVFIKELIDSQVLISELEPAVTGDEFIYQLIDALKKLNEKNNNLEINSIIQILITTKEQIQEIDGQIGNNTEMYRIIYQQLKALDTPIEENQLFQTDLYKASTSAILNENVKKDLQSAIDFLNRFSLKSSNLNLETFKENFQIRYEDSEILLLEALDTETGIGYTNKDKVGVNILLDDIFIPVRNQRSYNIKWNTQQDFLHERLISAIKKNDYTVIFTDEDIKTTENYSAVLPDSLSIMFRIIYENKLYIQNIGGSSAANLLGRFAHGDDTIHKIINDITTHEQNLNNGKILAEIVHLPESRIGNILLRPVLRNYEIPYLGKSALPAENQIQLQDLMISIRNGKIILRSIKLNKEVIPRLSTAHGYSFNALPAYQFLGDLQTQYVEKSELAFNWGTLSSNYKFLPRAEYKNIILARAKWQLLKSDYQILLSEERISLIDKIIEWRKQWNIPQYVVLVEADNELFVNFDDVLSIKMFVSVIKKKDRIALDEFLFDVDNLLIKDVQENRYTNEFIAVLLKSENKDQSSYPSTHFIKPVEEIVKISQRDFTLGSEWLYYKFYCGVTTADKLLSEVIKPLTEEIVKNKWADKFFFIRYRDPDLHIRLRFHVNNINNVGKIIAVVYQSILPYVDQGLVVKIQTDTYRREIERYGNNTMDITESFFYIDSIVTLNMLELISEDKDEQIRWQFAIRSVDELLTIFQYTPNEKLLLLEQFKEGYINEHSNSKELRLQLDTKSRNLRKHVENILNRELDAAREILPLIDLLIWKREQLKPVANKIIELKNMNQLQITLSGLMESYTHMMLNRIFRSRQRTYEMVIYDLLYRFYKSTLSIEKIRKVLL